uniref:Arrestin C-terminal-like domain-containing protein n=1 Tax=Stegastes partitus TaxID=144197 RepID=A0A3B4ZE27_9TELE
MFFSLRFTYNPINDRNTFSCGDSICGQVTLEVARVCRIKSLSVKFKGKAEVRMSESYGDLDVVFYSKDKYFSFKHYFIGGDNHQDNNVVAPGTHVYPFTIPIPVQDMPSSFKGSHGKIVFLLEATLSRFMRMNKKDSKKINFVSNVDWNSVPGLMTPQHESKEKKGILCSSGTVAIDVNIEKLGFVQGEELKVVAFIQNNSSRAIKPKYYLYTKHSFFARGHRKLETKEVLKAVGDPIPASSHQNVTRVITIPHDLELSILNCRIIKVEYILRVSSFTTRTATEMCVSALCIVCPEKCLLTIVEIVINK